MSDSMPRVIGIAGKARAGKSTAAAFISAQYGYEQMAFADPLKNMLRGLGLSEEQLEGSLKETIDPTYGVSPRHMMQTLGTQWGRQMVCEDMWVKRMAQNTGKIVISDVRFADEAEWVRENGLLIFVVRDGAPKINNSRHESERGIGMKAKDIMIRNETIEQFHATLAQALKKY